MSRLIAINSKSIKDFHDFYLIFTNLGQRRSNFLATIPTSIEHELKDIMKNFSELQRTKAEALYHKLKSEQGIFTIKNDNKFKDFEKKIKAFYSKDKRLEYAITNQSNPKPFKSLYDIDEWPLKDLEMDGVYKYSDDDINKIWNFFEFYFRLAPKIALIGRYNYIFDPYDSEPTNLHKILLKIFKEFHEKNCRCEEFNIYAAPPSKTFIEQKNTLDEQKEKIENFLRQLMELKKIKYGIKYHILTNHESYKESHQRLVLTNYSMFTLGDELAQSKNRNRIVPVSDPKTIKEAQDNWLENDFKNDNTYVIHVTD